MSTNLSNNHFRVATVAFARLERDHGEPLVRRALGYITASRKGLTMNELEDLMSLDDLVMEELSHQYKVWAENSVSCQILIKRLCGKVQRVLYSNFDLDFPG